MNQHAEPYHWYLNGMGTPFYNGLWDGFMATQIFTTMTLGSMTLGLQCPMLYALCCRDSNALCCWGRGFTMTSYNATGAGNRGRSTDYSYRFCMRDGCLRGR